MLINLTPHLVRIVTPTSVVEVPPSGSIARVAVTRTARSPIGACVQSDAIPVYAVQFGAVEGLPDAVDGTLLIVSAIVAGRSPRSDVFSPGELVRGPDGQPTGCLGLTASVA